MINIEKLYQDRCKLEEIAKEQEQQDIINYQREKINTKLKICLNDISIIQDIFSQKDIQEKINKINFLHNDLYQFIFKDERKEATSKLLILAIHFESFIYLCDRIGSGFLTQKQNLELQELEKKQRDILQNTYKEKIGYYLEFYYQKDQQPDNYGIDTNVIINFSLNRMD